jgi:hypothetical protein
MSIIVLTTMRNNFTVAKGLLCRSSAWHQQKAGIGQPLRYQFQKVQHPVTLNEAGINLNVYAAVSLCGS